MNIILSRRFYSKNSEMMVLGMGNLLTAGAKNNKEDTVEFVAERIERRLAETKADIEARIAAMETRLTWRLFAFWIGQAAFFYGLVKVYLVK
ncbi:hypothetical protein MOMUL_13430 [Moorella mulderi DSM 14980]|uniref:Uncharacterized protein n=2 Tax=Neomoorella TaxID=44260 RepID=A0A151AYM5_9FIRM|nr:hypothetical protein MOMUL_13430 [Moorella mulderi DSM 14980]